MSGNCATIWEISTPRLLHYANWQLQWCERHNLHRTIWGPAIRICFLIHVGYALNKLTSEDNRPGVVPGEALSCTETSTVFHLKHFVLLAMESPAWHCSVHILCWILLKGALEFCSYAILYSGTSRHWSVTKTRAVLTLLAPLPQRIYRVCPQSILSQSLPSRGGDWVRIHYFRHIFVFAALTKSDRKFSVWIYVEIFIFIICSSATAGPIRRFKYNKITFVLLFLQYEN